MVDAAKSDLRDVAGWEAAERDDDDAAEVIRMLRRVCKQEI